MSKKIALCMCAQEKINPSQLRPREVCGLQFCPVKHGHLQVRIA